MRREAKLSSKIPAPNCRAVTQPQTNETTAASNVKKRKRRSKKKKSKKKEGIE